MTITFLTEPRQKLLVTNKRKGDGRGCQVREEAGKTMTRLRDDAKLALLSAGVISEEAGVWYDHAWPASLLRTVSLCLRTIVLSIVKLVTDAHPLDFWLSVGTFIIAILVIRRRIDRRKNALVVSNTWIDFIIEGSRAGSIHPHALIRVPVAEL